MARFKKIRRPENKFKLFLIHENMVEFLWPLKGFVFGRIFKHFPKIIFDINILIVHGYFKAEYNILRFDPIK